MNQDADKTNAIEAGEAVVSGEAPEAVEYRPLVLGHSEAIEEAPVHRRVGRPVSTDPREPQMMKDGVETKALYIKHMSKDDWATIEEIQRALGGKSVADAVRFAVRRAGGKV